MKNAAIVCIIGGIAVLAAAIILRLTNLQSLFANPVTALRKVCVVLPLAAITIGVNK